MATDRENQIGSVTYVIGVLVGLALSIVFAPLSLIAALIWDEPPADFDVDQAAEMLSRCGHQWTSR